MSQPDCFDFATMSNNELNLTLQQHSIALSPDEALKIQSLLKRPPTLSECILWGIQGSEHCSYKSSRIHLKSLTTDGPNVVLGAQEDAGVVRIATDKQGQHYCLAISHESHNHPSQVVPFEGAATGIGGNVRDISCMGAMVIANADSLRFGDPTRHKTQWIQHGVVSGIASYSNAIGVPNIAGDVVYHPGYNDNCLVTVVSLGIVKESAITHSFAPENAEDFDLILVGKPTDNSGFGGASFASSDLAAEDSDANRSAVQEPNAFLGRMLLQANADLVAQLSAEGLSDQVGFKDLGAGGIACASVELAEAANMGASVCLDQVHTSISTLNPTVILCAETQERYMWVSPPGLTQRILDHYNKAFDLPNISQDAQAVVIGKITNNGQYQVRYRDQVLIDAKAKDITSGIVYDRPVKVPQRTMRQSSQTRMSINQVWHALNQHPNLQSEQSIYQHYDKQVQGRTIIERGRADAGVLQPFNDDSFPPEIQRTGIALSVAANPTLGSIDPCYAAQHAVVTTMNRVAAVGATPWAMTDCLCFGNPEDPEQMWEFVEAVTGLKQACETLTLKPYPEHPTPIIAGNVSLYNQSRHSAIPASPMISCCGRLEDVSYAIDWSLKCAGSVLMCLGARQDQLGGSLYAEHQYAENINLPTLDLHQARAQIIALTDCIEQGLVLSAKSIELGGLAFALKQMSQKHRLGCALNLDSEMALFSEASGFVIEVTERHQAKVRQLLEKHGADYQVIGEVIESHQLQTLSECLPFAQTIRNEEPVCEPND